MTNKFLTVINGIKKLVQAISQSAGISDAFKIIATNSQGKLDETFLPDTVGKESKIVKAGENLSAWDLVYFYDDSGVEKVKKAIATSWNTIAAGYVKEGASAGEDVTVYTDGYVSATGLTSNGLVYLSNTQAGKVTQTPPSSGIVQEVGQAISAVQFKFETGFAYEVV